MVLPPPAADAGPARAWPALGVIDRLLERSSQGTLVLLRGAVPTQLGTVVRALSPAPPWSEEGDVLYVCLRAAELAAVAPGSRVLLRVRAEDVDWLNLARPQFAQQRLRAVLWVEEEVLEPLRRNAVDLLDWVSRTVAVPERRWPEFAEQGVRAALGAGVPFAWAGEHGQLDALLGDVGWSDGCVRLQASMSVRDMMRALERPGLAVVGGIVRERDAWRVRIALAMAGYAGAWVALRPAEVPAGMWRLHARQAELDSATQALADAGWERAGTMAAWVDLEPERIDEAAERVGDAPLDPACWSAERVAAVDAPMRVLRARVDEAEVRAVREACRAGTAPEGSAEVALWSEGSEPWRDDGVGPVEARLVRSVRDLQKHAPAQGSVAAAAGAGLGDVAAELGRLRFERGEDERADDVVRAFLQYGEVEPALRVAQAWAERARSSGDEGSLTAALTWLGDLQVLLGNGEEAGRYYEESLSIVKDLVEREPGRTDLQRDLSVLYIRVGDLQVSLGSGEEAGRYYEQSLSIAKELVEREPGHTDLQRDLSVSLERQGDLQRALGDGEEAKRYYEESLKIRQQLMEREPGRTDLQQDLSVLYNKVGDLQVSLGNGEEAGRYYEESLSIAKELVEREPGRTDLQRDLSVSYNKVGDLQLLLGNGEEAGRYYEEGLKIRRQLVEREPGRMDLQRDLSVSLERRGDLQFALGNWEDAGRYYEESLSVAKDLVEREPWRTDLQRQLWVSSTKVGDLQFALGNGEEAGLYYEQNLSIAKQLVEREPDNYQAQGDLAISYERMAKVDPTRASEWLGRAVAIHRDRVALDPTHAITQRELGIALLQLGHSAGANGDHATAIDALREAYTLLRTLRDRGALEARHHPAVDQLAALFAQSPG